MERSFKYLLFIITLKILFSKWIKPFNEIVVNFDENLKRYFWLKI